MKKILMTLCFLAVVICTTGCNKYIEAEKNGTIYYGAYNRRDMIHADVKLFQANSDTFCDGIIFIDAPSRAITMKNDLVDARMHLTCSDGKLIASTLKFKKGSFDNLQGEGFDQLNNKYKFREISKSEFKELSEKTKVQFINDSNSSIIKY